MNETDFRRRFRSAFDEYHPPTFSDRLLAAEAERKRRRSLRPQYQSDSVSVTLYAMDSAEEYHEQMDAIENGEA